MGTGSPFPEGKAPLREVDDLPHPDTEFRMRGNISQVYLCLHGRDKKKTCLFLHAHNFD